MVVFGATTVGVIASIFVYANVLPLILSFVLMYAGTTLLLRHHSKRLGNTKYWVIICLPLIPFIAGLLPTLLALPSGGFTFYNKYLVTYSEVIIIDIRDNRSSTFYHP